VQQQQHDSDDARQLPRAETLKGAVIVFGAQKTESRCLIRNISPEGAELQLVSDQRVPQHFTLRVPHEGVAYRAQVRWREESRIGVAFSSAEALPKAALSVVAG